MSPATRAKVKTIGDILNQVSSTGAFIGAIVIIVQIGVFKGSVETTLASHERRIEKVEQVADILCDRVTAHEVKTP